MLRRRNAFQERFDRFLTELRNEILSGSLKPGEFIMPENALSETYKISRVSVRKALAQLVEEGLIEKIAGKGNRVRLPEEEIVRQTITLAWFSQSYEQDVLNTIIERFEESYPYVKVDLIILPAEKYTTRVAEMIEQGSGPDVFYVSDAHFRMFEESGQLHLLEPYKPADYNPMQDSYPKLAELYSVGDTLLAVPIHFSPVVICYNKEMFRRAGLSDEPIQTWDDLLEVARICTVDRNGDGMTDEYGFCFSSSPNRWPTFVLQNDGVFRKNGHSEFSNERNVEALQFCNDLMYKHQVSPIYSHSSNSLAEHLFKKERCAMIMSTYYFMNEFRETGIRWDVLPVPRNRSQATLLIGGALGINKYSEKRKVAQSFIDYVVGREAQTLLKQTGCTIPVLREIAEDNSLLNPKIHPEHYNRFKDSLEHGYSIRDLGLNNKDLHILYDELHLLWANMDSAEEVCRRIEHRMNAEVANNT